MAKRIKRTLPRKIKRNPLARALGSPKYRPRVVKRIDAYVRRPKHPRPPDELP